MRIPILSFFTGGGLLDLGFEEAGFDIVWTNENNKQVADIYEHGVTLWRLGRYGNKTKPFARISNRNSITELEPHKILHSAFKGRKPKIFGVIGGPPCIDFSVGGKNKGYQGEHGKLTKKYIDLICQIKPDFFLMENVPGLMRTTKHKLFLEELRVKLWNKGYPTNLALLNALNFGVPQDRVRLFMVGFAECFLRQKLKRSFLMHEDWFPFPDELYKNPKNLNWPTTNKFQNMVSPPEGIPEVLTADYWLEKKKPSPDSLPNGQDKFIAKSGKFLTIDEGDTSGKSFKRLHRYRFSPTACYGNNEVHLHPWHPRRLSVREVMRLQGIPDEYVLPSDVPLSRKFKLVSNAVPVPLAKHMALAIKAFIDETF